ncbi:AAA family ATPase [Paenibacillus sp. HJL G12]|uniref:AAA family ATPase n=1 Tax=Paenibacillus dendrobii TaxID=2691084 RepID=A0A7X3LHA5_9BACL|nr:AAA family ATPase [Paenibacillus dendrobii]MWV44045.1 AAA family ATPase [Paenibacillus dendrobii]
MTSKTFPNLKKIAQNMRDTLGDKKCYLIFAHNGTGKTRLSCMFKDLGKKTIRNTEEKTVDTLYYNAFTEDLFTWNNDLESDTQRVLMLNKESRFFNGIKELEMDTRIRDFLRIYADFDFRIDYDDWYVVFLRDVQIRNTTRREEYIKISRGEENIFIWSFFLAIAQLAIDKDPAYDWVKYIYIDDPISSLDDNNAVAVACHLAQLIKTNDMKMVVSTHHALFFNVMYNELKRDSTAKRFLSKKDDTGKYLVRDTGDTPFFHHIELLKQLKRVADSGKLYTYHFNILRNILEKTSSFHGFDNFSSCIKQDETDLDGTIHLRMTQLLNHGGYSIFEPVEMVEDNKRIFKEILNGFMDTYKFNTELFIEK